MDKQKDRIAVIGGGLSGLVIAQGLNKKGYKNITLFEKENNLGGKLHTIWYKGKSYEFGATFGLPSQKNLRTLMKNFNIKIDGPKLSRVHYDIDGNKIMQLPKEVLGEFIEELDRLPEVLDNYKSLESANMNNIEPLLMVSFSKWCNINKFQALKTVYGHYFASYGLGDIEVIPALYVLRILNYDNLMSFMDLPEFFTWKDGVHIIIERLSKEIKDIRLGQRVKSLSLSEENRVCVNTEFEELIFDKVVVSSPISIISSLYSDDHELQEFLSSIKYQDFSVYAFIADKVPKGCGCILENLSVNNRGHVVIWNSRWEPCDGEELIMVYAYNNPDISRVKSLEILKSDLLRLGIENPRLYQVRSWKQCPYVDTEVLMKGFYEKLENIQGKNNVFLAGEIMSTVSMENCIRYSNYVVNKYF